MHKTFSVKVFISFLLFAFFLTPAIASDKPEIFVQLGHTMSVASVAFSPDGKYVLSGSWDDTLKLWNVETGREIRTFTGHRDNIKSVAFSPDGKYALSGSEDRTLKLWDVATGKELRTFARHLESVKSVAFSPDGKYALSGSEDNTLKLWDVSTGKEIRAFIGHRGDVKSVAFSPDGKYALSGSEDNTLKLWDVSTGKEIRAFIGHRGDVKSVAFSPDGKYALSGSLDKTLKLWDVATGKELRTFTGHTDAVLFSVFSPDGKYALSGGIDTLKLWEAATGKEMRTFEGVRYVYSVAFSPDGKYALSAGSTGIGETITLWDIASGKDIRTLKGNSSFVLSVAFFPNGKHALSGSFDNTFGIWDIATGKAIRISKRHTAGATSMAFSSDGRHALSGSSDSTLKLWDILTGQEIRTFMGYSSPVLSIAFSPDGQYALTGSLNRTLKLLDIFTGREIWTSEGHADFITSVLFSPDGKYALSGSRDKTLKLWNIETGKEIWTFTGHTESVISVAFSPDGKYALSGSADNTLKLWDVFGGREIRTFMGHTESVTSIAFSPDGKYALSGDRYNIFKIWDIETGIEIKGFKVDATMLKSVAFSPDGRYALSGSGDGTARLWELSAGREIVAMVGFIDGEWIVITPEGYYNSSLNGHKYLNIRIGNDVYGIDQFYDVFYRPDIVTTKLRGEDISSLITLTIDEAIKNPPPSVEITSMPKDIKQPKVKVCYQAKSTGGGIGEVRLFHNGKLVHSDGFYKDIAKAGFPKQLAALSGKAIYEEMRGIKITAKGENSPIQSSAKGEIFEDCREIDAVAGENEVSIAAFNSQNTVQSYMKTMSFNAKVQPEEPHLYVLSIGIDKYKDPGINLRYAVKDAKDMIDKIMMQSTALYKPQNIHHEILMDKDATKTNILNRISVIAQRIRPADSFILFVAGHGVLLQNQYYMLTHGFDGDISEESLISSNEIVEMSKKIKSLSQLFVFDTCHAGGVDYIVSGIYDARMSVLAKKMGLHIYASANSIQQAMDGYQGNGLFTYTLLDGLNNNKNADKNKDNRISLVELGEHSKALTAEISKKIGHQQTPLIINFGKDNPLYQLR
jgi:WD40 repeat protein